MTRVPEMMAASVDVAFGYDCVMDPWCGLRSGDMLEVAHMGLHVAHMTSQNGIRTCSNAVIPNPIVPWVGVRNYQARNFMRNLMKVGDGVLFYHSSYVQPGIVGLARVASAPYPDPTQFDAQSPYFDANSTTAAPR